MMPTPDSTKRAQEWIPQNFTLPMNREVLAQRLAALLDEVRAEERERGAKVVDTHCGPSMTGPRTIELMAIAAAIRQGGDDAAKSQ